MPTTIRVPAATAARRGKIPLKLLNHMAFVTRDMTIAGRAMLELMQAARLGFAPVVRLLVFPFRRPVGERTGRAGNQKRSSQQ